MPNHCFLKLFRRHFDKNKNLWKLIINNKITLISKQDIDSCTISMIEAQDFLKENVEQIQEINSIENESDDDNEFDDLI